MLIHVPFNELAAYRKIHKTLVGELEKKFSGYTVVIVGQRTMLKPTCGRNPRFKGPRPRSRTLTAVHEAILDDVAQPAEIVGKRTRVKLDGSKQLKVMLTSKDAPDMEHKLECLAGVYKLYTNKEVAFEFASRKD